MSMNVNDKNIGHATAYAYAVAGGYTGTEAEFTELLGNIADDLGQIENLTVTVETLAAGSSATASYSNGVLHLGIPKGDKGDKGDTGATGPTGPTGNGIASVAKTGTSGLVDTYTITYTNGNTSTFTVTNGAEAVDDTLTIAGRAADAKKTGDEISALKSDLTQISAQIRVIAARDGSWRAIKENVKMGFGELLYPVGTEFEVECPSGAPYNSIIFVVVGHRVENNEHIMTMLMKHVIYSTEFDAIQAIICPEETMPAGTYHFALLSGYDTAYDGGKNVQFTLANDLEAGGQIVMNWPYNQTWIGKNMTAYHAFETSAIETCVMSEGTGGTDLGVADGTVSILNHTHRARYGSNNYKESAIRNWLDSDDAANAWQTQQTRFQRPCSYRTRAGFVTYLDPEFVAVIREGTHPNRTNEIFDLNGKKQAYSTTDKFYLASQEEIGFSSESGIVCGTVFDFYNGAAQSDKIKYDITAQTTARYWWLRTPYSSYAYDERYVYSSGALSGSLASFGIGAGAACEI